MPRNRAVCSQRTRILEMLSVLASAILSDSVSSVCDFCYPFTDPIPQALFILDSDPPGLYPFRHFPSQDENFPYIRSFHSSAHW